MQEVLSNTMRKKGAPDQSSTFDIYRRFIGLLGGPICALLVYCVPIDGIDPAAHTLLSIMTLVCLWWITEPVPIPVTSLIGPTLAVLCGVVNVDAAFAAFANPIIFLFMGGFIIAKAMTVHGLDRRFSYALLSMKWVGSSPTRIFLAIGIATALCSGWISNTASAAMMFPIALGLLSAIKDMGAARGITLDLNNYKFATGLMLFTAYSASIGGVLTPIGTPPNLIMMGFLESMEGIHISFFEWMIWGGLAMTIYFVIAAGFLHKMFPANVKRIEGAEAFIAAKRAELGGWTRGQKNTLIAFVIAVVLWVIPGILSMALGTDSPVLSAYNKMFPESIVALLAALLLFLLPINLKKRTFTLKWQDAVEGVDWGTLLLFGGGLAMGSMMYSTGLSSWVGSCIVNLLGGQPSELALIGTFCVLALVMSELTSHTAATNMVGPLGITAAISAGFSPIPVAVGIALSASLGFMLPVSTPPNAIVYASGYIPITKMIKTGFFIDAIGIAFVTIPIVYFVVTAVVGG